MRYAIPILEDRVAPRCTIADSILTVVEGRRSVRREGNTPVRSQSILDLLDVLRAQRVDTLICGGINRDSRDLLEAHHIEIIDNVVGSVSEIVRALRTHSLRSGMGLTSTPEEREPDGDLTRPEDVSRIETVDADVLSAADCLACEDRVCIHGQRCSLTSGPPGTPEMPRENRHMLEASYDIRAERERTLCRLSELIYFCLEMRYQRLGLAYCTDLHEPSEILVRVLRRFFTVYPVSCKVGGARVDDPTVGSGGRYRGSGGTVVCNPQGQADVLNRLDTDLNVMVGLCMGADCVFTKSSDAPVTALFVKDRSLANNPIGALYSDYYLNEAAQAKARSSPTPGTSIKDRNSRTYDTD